MRPPARRIVEFACTVPSRMSMTLALVNRYDLGGSRSHGLTFGSIDASAVKVASERCHKWLVRNPGQEQRAVVPE